MTSTICVIPIIAALIGANEYQSIKNVEWSMENEMQKVLIETYWPRRTDIDKLKDGEIKTKSSRDVSVVNQFLMDNNFTIRLVESSNPKAFYVASILKIVLEWEKSGSPTTLCVNEAMFPAVSMPENSISVHELGSNDSDDGTDTKQKIVILKLVAKNGDKIFMTQARSSQILSGFELLKQVVSWTRRVTKKNIFCYDEAIFPMVDINQEIELEWLSGLTANPGSQDSYEVFRALQQNKFEMNEKGAKVESAAAVQCFMDIACGDPEPKKIFKIDGPFYLWVTRSKMKIPIFAAYVGYDSWKSPNNLSFPIVDDVNSCGTSPVSTDVSVPDPVNNQNVVNNSNNNCKSNTNSEWWGSWVGLDTVLAWFEH